MSIYVVRLSEWYNKEEDEKDPHSGCSLHDACRTLVETTKCHNCGNDKMQYRYAMGHHALPWGYGDIWCTKKCYEKWLKQPKEKQDERPRTSNQTNRDCAI